MKHFFKGIVLLLLLLAGCRGEKGTPLSGTVTITNELFGTQVYYFYGFSFSLAQLVSSLDDPEPDITVEAGVLTGGTDTEAFLSANTLDPPFWLYGTYASAAEAETAFAALTSFGTGTWQDFGTPLEANQIWIMRTRGGTYAKMRVTEVTLDTDQTPDFASCTFRWAYQPDGTKTFE